MFYQQRYAADVAAFIAAVFLMASGAWAAEVLAELRVDSGRDARQDTPISVALEGIPIPAKGVRLVERRGEQQMDVPAQLEEGQPPRLSWILSGNTPAGSQRVFQLVADEPAESKAAQVKQDDAGLEIGWGEAKALRFHSAVMPPPAGADPRYARSGFIHPIWSPAGKVLTQIHPADHIHHMGLWNPWTSTEFEGRHVDFWNLKDGTGTVRFVKFLGKASGPVFGGFQAALEHVDLSAPGGEKVVLSEVLDVRVWQVGAGEKKRWLVDYVTTQRCASSSPLKLLAYRYGGLGFRGTGEWNASNSNYLTSEGKDRKTGHGTRARWCNVFGETSKGPAGVEFMSHPQNREHPEPMRIWPDGYIFFNFCPIQKAEWILEPGQDYVRRYRLCVYDGKLSVEDCERLWQDFGNPPVVKVVRK